jgi:hypothetical protein
VERPLSPELPFNRALEKVSKSFERQNTAMEESVRSGDVVATGEGDVNGAATPGDGVRRLSPPNARQHGRVEVAS